MHRTRLVLSNTKRMSPLDELRYIEKKYNNETNFLTKRYKK